MSHAVCPFLLSEDAFARLSEDFICGRPQLRAASSKQACRLAPWAFRRWMAAQAPARLDEEAVKVWLLERTSLATVLTVTIQANIVALFVDFLVARGLVSCNPFRELKRKHRARGMRGIVRHLTESRSSATLDAKADVPFSGPLAAHFRRYLDHRRALGIASGGHECYLASFERFLRERQIADLASITRALVEEWSHWQGETTEHNHRYRILIVGKLLDFLAGHRVIERSPVTELMRYRRRFVLPPHIYSRDEVRQILEAARALPDHHLLPHRGPTYQMYFLTLYALGLRRNEALDLRVSDVDFEQQAVTVREGKFRKGRVLPFGPKLRAAFERYIESHPLLQAATRDAFLFPTASGRTPHLSQTSVAVTLRQLLDELHIVAREGTRRPGLHSIRHSFAVHRLERWHRESADLNVKLPLLSAFLGHSDLACTQIYLTMTPERLRLVGEAFERSYGASTAPIGSDAHET